MQTVLVVVANRFVGESLAGLFRSDKRLRLLGMHEFSLQVSQAVAQANPDIVVLSPEWDDATARATHAIHQAVPHTKILMIGMKDDEEMFLRAVRAGAVGYLLKEASAKDILAAAHRLEQNLVVCPPHLEWVLFRSLSAGSAVDTPWREPNSELTPRERELTFLVVQGLANKEIAERMNLSLQTVKNHVHNVLRKTGTNSRTRLTRVAQQQI